MVKDVQKTKVNLKKFAQFNRLTTVAYSVFNKWDSFQNDTAALEQFSDNHWRL